MSAELQKSYTTQTGALPDVPPMAEIAARLGQSPQEIARGCERVIREPYGFSTIAVSRSGRTERLVGTMNAVLLRPKLGERIRKGEVPFSQFLANEPERFAATEAEVGLTNGDGGHDLFITHFIIDPDLSAEANERVMALLVSGFVERAVGNHVRSILFEAPGREFAQWTEHSGYRIVNSYDEWQRRSRKPEALHPFLVESDRELIVRSFNLHMTRLLSYQPPTLRFPPAAREVIRCAYLGYSDARIVEELGLTPASLNSRWTRILDIAEAKMPSLFTDGKSGRARDRGPLLAYLRNHPEEMWPYEPRQEGVDTARKTQRV